MRLLIADDESFIRKGLLSLDWQSIGIKEVLPATNGLEAREILTCKPVDIAIFDIKMPGMTGLELSSMIKEQSLDTAVVLLTGFSEFEYARQAIQNDVCEYLLKPVKPQEVLKTVERTKVALEQKRYQAKVMREYEEVTGVFDTVSQVRNHFSNVSESISSVLEDIAVEFSDQISLGELANRYHFSKNYLSKKIKQETGYSYIDILMAIRLMNAAQFLVEGQKVNPACFQAGFNDQRYFSQVFRRAFDCSPSEFKTQSHDSLELRLHFILEAITKKNVSCHDENK
ncbi:response regulator transcription factor [Lapidilactobacillus salsurivasis]